MVFKREVSVAVFCLSFITLTVRAQDYYSSVYDNRPVSFGITLAPNLSWLRYGDTDVISNTTLVGYAYGLLADFAFAENYYFASGFLINTLQARSEQGTSAGGIRQSEYRIQYAEIPFGLKLKSTQRYFRSYYGQFGFTGGIKLSGKERYEDRNGGIVTDDGSHSLGGDAGLIRLGLQIGGGVEWLLDHNLRMMTGVSYNNGFTRVLKNGDPRNTYAAFNFAILF